MDDNPPDKDQPEIIEAGSRRQLGEVDQSFYIIGVGASAGGLDAIKQLVGQADADFPHSFVIIQHISPDHKSLMSEILTRETKMRVLEVTDDMALQPGHIYLIPPKSNVVIQGTMDDTQPSLANASLLTKKGLRFSLVAPSPRPQLNLPIDIFFHSLAEAVGDRAIAIVLSGTGTDGSRGLRTVKDRDGFVMVQDPETADFDGMPAAAIATQIVDMVAAPDAMISEIRRFIAMRDEGVFNIDTLFRNAEESFQDLLVRISEGAGIDFTQYKKPTLKRRIARRVALTHSNSLKEYVQFVDDNPAELGVLHREFLVGVTNFFRDLPAWNTLLEKIIPKLFAEGDQDQPVKVWSVGCSTGEEAYTIALILEKYRLDHGIARDFRVFASDVNEDAILSAKDGIYPESVLEEIPGQYRRTDFMSFHGGTFHISSNIRNRLIFNTHNVLQEPPYINTDLITCRNLLIYVSPDMQKKVLSLFSFSLRSNGFLFLGAAENVMHQFAKFETEISAARIFKNTRTHQRTAIRATIDPWRSFSAPLPRLRRLATREQQRSSSMVGTVLEQSLTNVDGCLIIIDEGGNILETFGNYRRFVNLPEQAFSANIFDLVHERLKSSFSLLIRQAETEGHSKSIDTRCALGDRIEQIDIFCERIEWETQPLAYSLMLRRTDQVSILKSGADGGQKGGSGTDHTEIARLESEIETLREMLNATTEDLGISNEELQTANEELTVSNEELQANNEEMQSINEELHTVNAENAEKIVQLEAANADVENLLNTADLAVVFLDETLAIRRFNPAITRYVDLKQTDAGRRLTSFASSFTTQAYKAILEDAERASRGGDEINREAQLSDGSWALVRSRPFKLRDSGEHSGVVVTALDITTSKILQEEVRIQRDRLEGLLESEAAGYWELDLLTGTEYLSPRCREMLLLDSDNAAEPAQNWRNRLSQDDLTRLDAALQEHIKSKGKIPYDEEVCFQHPSGEDIWVQRRGRVIEWSDDGRPLKALGVHLDISRLKAREMRVSQDAENIFGFAYTTAHGLTQPVNTSQQCLEELAHGIEEGDIENVANIIDTMQGINTRMGQSVAAVVEFSKLFSEGIELQNLDLRGVAESCAMDMAKLVESVDAQLDIAKMPNVYGRPELIARVFQSLIGNSIKFRHLERPCKISIKAKPLKNDMVQVTVSDNGIGVNPAVRDKAFELFYKYHKDPSYNGVGTGLAVCRRIVNIHGGTIAFGDDDGNGTSVVFTLQAAREQ